MTAEEKKSHRAQYWWSPNQLRHNSQAGRFSGGRIDRSRAREQAHNRSLRRSGCFTRTILYLVQLFFGNTVHDSLLVQVVILLQN